MNEKLWTRLAILAALGILLLGIYLRQANMGRRPNNQSGCSNNLRQLNIALLGYQDTYGSLPPAVVYDENGKPMHSWRALILPFIEESQAFKNYDFQTPWDSPNNLAVAGKLNADLFACPSIPENGWPQMNRKPNTRYTNYVAVTGPGTAFDGVEGTRHKDIRDGLSQTILLVEFSHSDIQLLEPRDISAEELIAAFANSKKQPAVDGRGDSNQGARAGKLSHHPGGLNASLADGSVRFIEQFIKPETIRAMTTIAAGDVVGEF